MSLRGRHDLCSYFTSSIGLRSLLGVSSEYRTRIMRYDKEILELRKYIGYLLVARLFALS